MTGLPRLSEPHFRRAEPTTPADQAGARVGCFPAHAGLPQNGREVGIRVVAFEACSGFTHVKARRTAQPPSGLCHEAPALPVARPTRSSATDQSTTLWVDSSSTSDSRLRGARPSPDMEDFATGIRRPVAFRGVAQAPGPRTRFLRPPAIGTL